MVQKNERCFFEEPHHPIVGALPVDEKFKRNLAMFADFSSPFLFYEKQAVCRTRPASEAGGWQ